MKFLTNLTVLCFQIFFIFLMNKSIIMKRNFTYIHIYTVFVVFFIILLMARNMTLTHSNNNNNNKKKSYKKFSLIIFLFSKKKKKFDKNNIHINDQ